VAFGMPVTASAEYADRMKYDANSGRLFLIDRNPTTYEKENIDITSPAPSFALDFGTIEVGYGAFDAGVPDYRLVPLGRPLPPEPRDVDEKGRLKFRQSFKVKAYGKSLNGLREWSSSAKCVLAAIEDLFEEFKASPEASDGLIPVVTLVKTVPVTTGKGPQQRTVYAPVFVINRWVPRVEEMGPRTVAAPRKPLVV
jgi:hypothetical protein